MAVHADVCLLAELIESWWKQLRSLALKGRRFEEVDDMIEAVVQATAYWHQAVALRLEKSCLTLEKDHLAKKP